MKKSLLFVYIVFSAVSTITVLAQSSVSLNYISPKPGSKLLSRETNIIFSQPENIDQGSLTQNNIITVTGSVSGIHRGRLTLSDDGKTIIFNPSIKFAAGEKVTVRLNNGIRTASGKAVQPVSFSFTVTPLAEPIKLDPIEQLGLGYTMNDLYSKMQQNTSLQDSLPADFPEITIGTVNDPAPGSFFLSNLRFGNTNTDGFYMMIIDNSGNPVKYKRSEPFPAIDFDMQPNGLISYADISQLFLVYGFSQFKVMDTSLTVVDSFQCGNGYQADFHDFRLLPNGHAILMAYDPQPVDMSQYVSGGDPNAIVIGGIIQELDNNKNVIFQWRSWDHFNITDTYHELTGSLVDYVHLNSVDFDSDGNLLISSRHFSEVTKVSRQTGDIIWRLGGKNNQFTFINENPDNAPNYFSFQHDVRRIANGNITMFDNGNQHSPNYSRGVEYQVDEQNKTATMVWEYRHSPDLYGFATGSVQRLPNGNSIIGWGTASTTGGAVLTEVHPDNSVAYELFFPLELVSYRAFKYPWVSGLPAASVTVTEILEGNTYEFNNSTDTTATRIKFNLVQSVLYNSVNVKRYEYPPANLQFDGQAPGVFPLRITGQAFGIDTLNVDIYFQLGHLPQITDPGNVVVYARPTIGSGTFMPLVTTYNPSTNELKVSGVGHLGEFIFAYPDFNQIPFAPVLLTPENNALVNENLPLHFQWSPKGFTNKYRLQVSTDAGFGSTVVDDSSLIEPEFVLSSLMQNQQYFWRVSSKNLAGWSDWSDVWSFDATAPFINVTFPNGGEVWRTDSALTIKWDHNLLDSVKIELYRNDSFYSTVVDTLFSITGGYLWTPVDSIPSDSTYKILVTSLRDNSLQDMSDNNFSIIYVPVGIEDLNEVVTNYELKQNYPNPFNPSTIIRYSVPSASRITLKIYNSIGELLGTLADGFQTAGSYEVTWNAGNYASGIYFYVLDAIPSEGSNAFHSVRKMILLK